MAADSSESSSDSSSCESGGKVDEDEDLAEKVGKKVFHDPASRPGFVSYPHSESGMLHWRVSTVDSRLLRNRNISKSCKLIDKALRFAWPVCTQCSNVLDR